MKGHRFTPIAPIAPSAAITTTAAAVPVGNVPSFIVANNKVAVFVVVAKAFFVYSFNYCFTRYRAIQ